MKKNYKNVWNQMMSIYKKKEKVMKKSKLMYKLNDMNLNINKKFWDKKNWKKHSKNKNKYKKLLKLVNKWLSKKKLIMKKDKNLLKISKKNRKFNNNNYKKQNLNSIKKKKLKFKWFCKIISSKNSRRKTYYWNNCLQLI